MRKKCKLVALLVVICMVATLLPIVPAEEYEASEKVSAELLELLDVTYEDLTAGNYIDSGETYSCIIWIQDVDVEEAVEAGIDAAEMTRDGYSARTVYDYPYSTYKVDGLTYVDVDLDDNESDEYVQAYIEAEREKAVELYSDNNNSFVAENFMARDMSVTYVSKYSPCVFADLNITKIGELIVKDAVSYVGVWEGGNASNDSVGYDPIIGAQVEQCVELIRADEATDIYNVTGEGVKIGQIEDYCPDDSSVVKNSPLLNTTNSTTTHEDDVHLIMSTVAPDATYYATSLEINVGSFYEQVEWLLSQGVNIINMSYGWWGTTVANKYTDMARWVDHIAYNHDVHFVKSAGNRGNVTSAKGVTSPGMAYNIITVGNTYRHGDYLIRETSSYNHNGAAETTYKPDIVAPGTYYKENGTVYTSGTSFATPLVVGTIALMCEYRPALKTKQHIVKAILAATTSKTIYENEIVTTDSRFPIYGAGMLDARSALYALYMGDYVNYTGELKTLGASRSYKMNVTSSDTYMRVALAYANRVEFPSTDNIHSENDTPICEIGKLGLEIYDPNGNCVAQLYSRDLQRNANLKVLQFNTNGVTGDYIIKVIVEEPTDDGRTINFGVAWR